MPRYLAAAPAQAEGIPVTLGAGESATVPPFSVPPGQRLVAVVNNGSWQVALDVTFPDNLERIMRRCRDGVWQELALYLMPEERVAEISDGRRSTMEGEPVQEPVRRPSR
jgi:hypothetical protein